MATDAISERQTGLAYEVVEDNLHPGDWRVEAIDHASEGECYIAIFTGPRAEERAREYAMWKNEQAPPIHGSPDQ
jgi:hypothetical protein